MSKYDRLRARAKAERDKTIKAANEQYDKAVKAIALVQQMDQGKRPSPGSDHGQLSRGALAKAVRDIAKRLGGEFTVREIFSRLNSEFPDVTKQVAKSSVYSLLRRLARDSEIITIEKGRGKRATTYRRAMPDAEAHKQPRPVAKGMGE